MKKINETQLSLVIGGNACGQKVMDCINDAYSKKGWISVYVWVQSAILPQTAVAIAAACAYKNC